MGTPLRLATRLCEISCSNTERKKQQGGDHGDRNGIGRIAPPVDMEERDDGPEQQAEDEQPGPVDIDVYPEDPADTQTPLRNQPPPPCLVFQQFHRRENRVLQGILADAPSLPRNGRDHFEEEFLDPLVIEVEDARHLVGGDRTHPGKPARPTSQSVTRDTLR